MREQKIFRFGWKSSVCKINCPQLPPPFLKKCKNCL